MKPKNDLRPEAASRWLEKTRRDLDTAFLNHRHGGYTDVTCYFCHQTVEKSLKAFLVYHSIRFQKIHVLPTLLKMCQKKNRKLSKFEEACKILDNYYIETKYPLDVPIVYTKREAREALEKAEEIYNFVKEKLNL